MSKIAWSGVVVIPLLLLGVLLVGFVHDPVWAGPSFHFYIVSLTSLQALFLALLMLAAANQLRNGRVFFLAMAFLGIAGIFLVHALTTPGILVSTDNNWAGFSARLSLFVGSIFFALSTIQGRRRFEQWIVAHQTEVTGAVVLLMVLYGAVALATSGAGSSEYAVGGLTSSSYSSQPSDADAASYGASTGLLASPGFDLVAGVVPLVLLAFVIARYVMLYRLSGGPLVAGFLVSAIFLFQAQLSMAIAPVWHASWWEYHGLLLASFGAAIVGLVLEYRQNGSLSGVVEGLLLRDTLAQLQRGYTDVIVALVEAIEAKDLYTHGHTQRVSDLATLIGEELGLPPERLRVLHQAAMLHDIGKIGVPDSILNKPGRLTPEEFAVIKEHPVRGHQIIRNVRSLQQEIGGVRYHHEKLDGSGYPDGLVGDAIPMDARIIAVADIFDALTSARAYRTAWPLDRAVKQIDDEAVAKLDASCVAAFHRVLAQGRGRRPGWIVAMTAVLTAGETPAPVG